MNLLTHIRGKCSQEWIASGTAVSGDSNPIIQATFFYCFALLVLQAGEMGDKSPEPIFSSLATVNEYGMFLFHCPDIILGENTHLLKLSLVFIFELVPVTRGMVHVSWTVWTEYSFLWWKWQALIPEKVPFF